MSFKWLDYKKSWIKSLIQFQICIYIHTNFNLYKYLL